MSKLGPHGGRIEAEGNPDAVVIAGELINRPPTLATHHTNTPVRILFLSANPAGTQELKLISECNNIREKIRAARYADEFDFEQWHEASLHRLQGYLLGANPQIVHFSGHGAEDGTLVFEDFEGQPETAKIQTIANLFRILNERRSISVEKNVRCVVLSACYSENQARELAKYVDCVVGMKNAVLDEAAKVFAESFYQGLGEGESVQTAFELGKNQVELLSIPGQDIPKLEVRDGIDPSGVFVVGRKAGIRP